MGRSTLHGVEGDGVVSSVQLITLCTATCCYYTGRATVPDQQYKDLTHSNHDRRARVRAYEEYMTEECIIGHGHHHMYS